MTQLQRPEIAAGGRSWIKRQTLLALSAALILLLLVGCAGVAPEGEESAPESSAATQSADTESAASETDDADAEEAETDGSGGDAEPLITAIVEGDYNGIPVGFTSEGYPFRGDPDAPVVMFEYSDYQCPFCSRYFVQTEPALNEAYVRNGELLVVFRDFPLEQLHPNAPGAHLASLCVAEQGAVPYWEMHAQLFRTQAEWSNDPNALEFYAGLAEDIGIDMDQYAACMAGDEVQEKLAVALDEARTKGFTGTPSFEFINAADGEPYQLVGAQPFDEFATWVEAVAAGEAPGNAQAGGEEQGDGEIPFWATAEGLTPDPERPGVTMSGDYYRGNVDAPVVVVEYSDFQCPFCGRHNSDTQPVLDEQFVDTDQVLWVFKHFPLSIHPQAPMAGVAAECAGEQGQFWEMHHELFGDMSSWSVNDPTLALTALAEGIDLDIDAFAACLEDEEMMARVESDLADGTPFVRGTPTFIVLAEGEGSIIPGALPAENFTQVIQEVLDGVNAN